MMDVSGPLRMDAAAAAIATAVATEALERQAAALRALHSRVCVAASLAPESTGPDWRGPAQQLYDRGLVDLNAALVAAIAAVDDALAETRLAVSSLASRGG